MYDNGGSVLSKKEVTILSDNMLALAGASIGGNDARFVIEI